MTNFNWRLRMVPYSQDENSTLKLSPIQMVDVTAINPLLNSAIQNTNATIGCARQRLALMIHFMGNIHQLLHDATMFSNEYRQSNDSINAQTFTIDFKEAKILVHAYWDSIAEEPAAGDYLRLWSKEYYASLNVFSNNLEVTYASNQKDTLCRGGSRIFQCTPSSVHHWLEFVFFVPSLTPSSTMLAMLFSLHTQTEAGKSQQRQDRESTHRIGILSFSSCL
uniref:3'-nucleotidase/nuclease, putative n=1 Tax=Leishmania guyanensis TaxID=5670 RepID=A0A1E1J320_LEIGU|nr:3'-nucleotidase/nuclease, putative [Leishmania guyanensis]